MSKCIHDLKDTNLAKTLSIALKSIYGVNGDPLIYAVNQPCNLSSWFHTWKSLIYGLKGLADGMLKRIGNGEATSFWKDNWLGMPICQYPDVLDSLMEDSVRVCEFITAERKWDLEKIFAPLPMDVANRVIGCPIPRFSAMQDSFIWKHSSDGVFNTRSAYLALLIADYGEVEVSFSWIWKLPIPPRWQFFVWLAWRDRLLTNARRASWGLNSSPECTDDFCLWRNIMATTTEALMAHRKADRVTNHQFLVAWRAPRNGKIKLNTDGASQGNPGNFCADILSKMGCTLDEELVIFNHPPAEVLPSLNADRMGVYIPRGFTVN
ncbi:hypothetical protein F3Y22_tig00110198pilonHSYRG00213 [Hibiscus syriacus]|uniref:Reverse transcriptase zinc-binding domain-containing protein n=1 Tax=Hibiscus syriacus TaxID=106335 RepID=A0A6A3BBI8_HIBSY|nr:hypothetical protein F3Y22_tig00110198pilonHSYRG00213 [Hibiscus syriacus]